jgi:hypothetical protein
LTNAIKAIPVRDANGDALTVYVYRHCIPYLRAIGLTGRIKRIALDTGEEVKRVNKDIFVLAGTGERLTRIK